MTLKMILETVSPASALKMLEKSGGNRAMRSDHIASLAAQMKRGEWMDNGASIVFDEEGQLIDGHHRLMACHVSGVPIRFLVVRDAPKGAMFTIDAGQARTLGDHLALNGGTNTKRRASYINAVARLLCGVTVSLKTVEAYQRWEPIVHEGTEAFFALGLMSCSHMSNASLAAPLILTYKVEPEIIGALWIALRDGENLKLGTAAHTLREFLVGLTREDRRTARDTSEVLAAKIFAAVQAHLAGRPLRKLQASAESFDFFRKLYTRGPAGKLVTEAKQMRQAARKIVTNIVPGEHAA